MENRDILPRKKMESITYGAQCLVKQTMPCAECPIHAEGHEYPGCLHELGQMILNMKKIIEDQEERIEIMAVDMPVWIDITKEQPTKDDRDILVISEGEVCFCTHYFTGNGLHEYETPDIFESFPIENITHWMRCPKPPKEGDPRC